MRTVLAGLIGGFLLGGCGTPSSTTPATTASSSASASASATAVPPPDLQRVDIVASGVGAYMLVAIPVAILHNAAARTAATGVVVHFDVTRHGAKIFALDSPAVMLFPGQTLAVAANCTDTCNGADGAEPTVAVTRWTVLGGAPISVDPGVYSCGSGCGGHGYGSVATTLHGPGLTQNKAVDLFAACTNAGGAVVGGGQRQLTWPQTGGTVAVTVPVILSAGPVACQVSASPPSSTLG